MRERVSRAAKLERLLLDEQQASRIHLQEWASAKAKLAIAEDALARIEREANEPPELSSPG